MTGHVDPTREAMAAFRALPGQTPIAMINLLRFRERAAYSDDHPGASGGLTGAQAYDAYGRAAAAPFTRAGGERVWLGAPQATLIGPSDERWDLAFVARYPSADAFLSMLADPEYQAAVVHRQAAVATSRLIPCTTPGAAS